MSTVPTTEALRAASKILDRMEEKSIWIPDTQHDREVTARFMALAIDDEFAALRGRVLPKEITPAIQDVLEMMITATGPIGRAFREVNKVDIPRKIEKEHAYVIWWLLGHALKHGDDWRKFAAEELPVAPKPEVVQS